MAIKEQLAVFKQGPKAWNEWRLKNMHSIYLGGADLRGADLRDFNLIGVNFELANLCDANLSGIDLREVKLCGANLSHANLSMTDLREVDLSFEGELDYDEKGRLMGDLREPTLLSFATLMKADLRGADLTYADLEGANLTKANLKGTYFGESDIGSARVKSTVFTSLDLSEAVGLEAIEHVGPSVISTDTLELSKGKIPATFLRGCGLPDWLVESANLFNPDLDNEEIARVQNRMYDLRATQAIQINPLFISYSHGDTAFIDKMDKMLTAKGVRFWRDIHDMMAGKIEKQVDRAIRQNPTVLLVLSKNSLQSDWVEHEVNEARKAEKELGRDVLCPVALDEGWKSSKWEERVMEQIMKYNILDFSKWEDESAFEEKFAKLLSGLDLFYKKPKG